MQVAAFLNAIPTSVVKTRTFYQTIFRTQTRFSHHRTSDRKTNKTNKQSRFQHSNSSIDCKSSIHGTQTPLYHNKGEENKIPNFKCSYHKKIQTGEVRNPDYLRKGKGNESTWEARRKIGIQKRHYKRNYEIFSEFEPSQILASNAERQSTSIRKQYAKASINHRFCQIMRIKCENCKCKLDCVNHDFEQFLRNNDLCILKGLENIAGRGLTLDEEIKNEIIRIYTQRKKYESMQQIYEHIRELVDTKIQKKSQKKYLSWTKSILGILQKINTKHEKGNKVNRQDTQINKNNKNIKHVQQNKENMRMSNNNVRPSASHSIKINNRNTRATYFPTKTNKYLSKKTKSEVDKDMTKIDVSKDSLMGLLLGKSGGNSPDRKEVKKKTRFNNILLGEQKSALYQNPTNKQRQAAIQSQNGYRNNKTPKFMDGLRNILKGQSSIKKKIKAKNTKYTNDDNKQQKKSKKNVSIKTIEKKKSLTSLSNMSDPQSDIQKNDQYEYDEELDVHRVSRHSHREAMNLNTMQIEKLVETLKKIKDNQNKTLKQIESKKKIQKNRRLQQGIKNQNKIVARKLKKKRSKFGNKKQSIQLNFNDLYEQSNMEQVQQQADLRRTTFQNSQSYFNIRSRKVIKKNIVDESHEEEEVLILEKSRAQLSKQPKSIPKQPQMARKPPITPTQQQKKQKLKSVIAQILDASELIKRVQNYLVSEGFQTAIIRQIDSFLTQKRKVRFIRDKIDEGVLNGEDGELYRYGELFVRRGKLKSMFKIFQENWSDQLDQECKISEFKDAMLKVMQLKFFKLQITNQDFEDYNQTTTTANQVKKQSTPNYLPQSNMIQQQKVELPARNRHLLGQFETYYSQKQHTPFDFYHYLYMINSIAQRKIKKQTNSYVVGNKGSGSAVLLQKRMQMEEEKVNPYTQFL